MVGESKKRRILTAEEEDVGYFDAYGSLSTHRLMLEDTARTEAYRNAIDKQRFEGKTVLDVGCGTGVLSIFAAKAGAKKVYAVDGCGKIAALARKIIQSNNLSSKIEVIHSKVEDLQLPEKVDIIISEWMGYFLIYESMFQSVITARDKFLKPNGLILPEKSIIKAAPFSNHYAIDGVQDFWKSKPYDIDYSLVADEAIRTRFKAVQERDVQGALDQSCSSPTTTFFSMRFNVQLDALPENESQLADSVDLWTLDSFTVTIDDLAYMKQEFEFKTIINGQFHGICVWFDCHFGNNVVLSTGPDAETTHWYQACLYIVPETLNDKFIVKQDDVITSSLELRPKGRSLNIDLKVRVGENDEITRNYFMEPPVNDPQGYD